MRFAHVCTHVPERVAFQSLVPERVGFLDHWSTAPHQRKCSHDLFETFYSILTSCLHLYWHNRLKTVLLSCGDYFHYICTDTNTCTPTWNKLNIVITYSIWNGFLRYHDNISTFAVWLLRPAFCSGFFFLILQLLPLGGLIRWCTMHKIYTISMKCNFYIYYNFTQRW